VVIAHRGARAGSSAAQHERADEPGICLFCGEGSLFFYLSFSLDASPFTKNKNQKKRKEARKTLIRS
jgi:hypothetical protein